MPRFGLHRIFTLRAGWALAIVALIDIVCTGMGMGVPIFCILYGLPVGWYLARWIAARSRDMRQMLTRVLLGAAVTSGFTLVMMVLLWGPSIAMLFDPAADLANFGIPLILYEPTASFVGWLVLMMVISPFLQFLMTLLGAYLTVLWWVSSGRATNEGGAGAA